MVVDVKFAAECILLLNSHKWYVDKRYLANVLRMSCEEFQEAMDALKNGGQGTRSSRTSRSGGSFIPNPKPYHQKISFSESVDNILNLHEADYGRRGDSSLSATSPSEAVLQERCRSYRIGNNRERIMTITPCLQKEIVKMVIGTHQLLETKYHDLGRQRKNIWRGWIEGTDHVDLYDQQHLTYIILYFPTVWNFTLPLGATEGDVTTAMRYLANALR